MNRNLQRAMRYAQLTICEGDIGKFDPDRWLAYLDECFCDGLVLGSGGYIAYHETDIPFHYRVRDDKFGDLFGYMVNACRKKGYAVICRTDSHAIHEDAFRAHPEWAAVTSDGKPRRHWSYPAAYVSCPLGPYGFDFMKRVHGELAAKYDLDGVFCNRWPGSGVCFCDSCRESFRAFSGREIPTVNDPADETVRLYQKWREARAFELCRCWDGEIVRNNPQMRFIPNSSVGTDPFLDNRELGEYAEVLYADYQGRAGLMTPLFNGRTAKELHAVLQGKPVGGIFSTGTCEKRWKDSVQEPAELQAWISEAVANGLRPWFTKFSCQVFDERWMPVVKNLYRKYHDWERYLKDTASAAEIALMFSQQTVKEYALRERDRLCEKPINGWYHALTEAHIPFDMFDSHYIEKERLSRYRAVILPNIAVLSDRDCAVLRDYAASGGALIATFETSLYDEEGRKREDFGLAEPFGVHANRKDAKDERNAYIAVLPGVGDPLMVEGFFGGETEGWCGKRRLCGVENRVGISWEPEDFEESPFRAVPAFPDLPMEEVYPRSAPADYRDVFFRKTGKGRVAYFPGDIDRCYWDYLLPDHRRLMTNAVRWAISGDDAARVSAPGL
ncbi:MAG: beta-galactosidase trimerization domain-containing protein, partial [Clostridia bacterium]|nr:beta-galactosidase trimerization domain-containing protein [Clostridia bacterium]